MLWLIAILLVLILLALNGVMLRDIVRGVALLLLLGVLAYVAQSVTPKWRDRMDVPMYYHLNGLLSSVPDESCKTNPEASICASSKR